MNEYLLVTAEPGNYNADDYAALVEAGRINGDTVLDIIHSGNPLLDGDQMIGAWAQSGVAIEPLDRELWDAIRPLGNLAEEGREGQATKDLLYHHYDGWGQRELGDPLAADPVARLYPADDQPFWIVIDHHWYEQAEFSGWGFLAEIWGGDQARDPGVHSLGIYADEACTEYLWTPGGAVQFESRLGKTDADGNPALVYGWETPAGQRTAEKEQWNVAVLRASIQMGYQSLRNERIEYLFWSHTQGQSAAEWTDSGVTVTQIYGAGVLGVTDSSVFVADEMLRIAGVETQYVREHAENIIVVEPHVADSVGENIYWRRG